MPESVRYGRDKEFEEAIERAEKKAKEIYSQTKKPLEEKQTESTGKVDTPQDEIPGGFDE